MVHGAVGQREGAQTRHLLVWRIDLTEVVLGARGALLLGERDTEVEVEVVPQGGDPGEAPAHAPLVRLERVERRAGRAQHRHVAVGEMDDRAVERGPPRTSNSGSPPPIPGRA